MTNSEILVVTVYFFLSISLLVVLHELGHFLAARYFGTRVEKFYLFFDPWFALWKRKIGGTEYGIGWLPLGGYVKISGMVDESMDSSDLTSEPKEYEFRAKPAWQRLIIMLGGIIVNVLLGIFIFAMLLWKDGETNLPPQNCKYGMEFSSVMHDAGLEDGDIITTVNHQQLEDYTAWAAELILGDGDKSIEVLRNGTPFSIPIGDSTLLAIQHEKEMVHVRPLIPFVVDSLFPNGSAIEKLKEGDRIIGFENTIPLYFQQIGDSFKKHKSKPVMLQVLRAGDTLPIQVVPDEKGKIGLLVVEDFNRFFDIDTIHYSFFQSLGGGYRKAKNALTGQAKGMYKMATDDGVSAKDNLGGFISIAKLFPSQWGDWDRFWRITGLLSLILAFMNLLPIPALDGGHVVFLLYEMITGRTPSLRVMEIAQVAGMVLVLGLILYINGREIVQAIFG